MRGNCLVCIAAYHLLLNYSPPLSFYSRKPVITLPARMMHPTDKEQNGSTDVLDMHVEELLSRKQKIRRSLQGLWAFLKTPIGIVTGKFLIHHAYIINLTVTMSSYLWRRRCLLGSRYRPLPCEDDQSA